MKPDKRISGRSKKMGLSAKPEFCEKLRTLSFKERRLQIEILEEALELYEKKKKNKQKIKEVCQLLGVSEVQEIETILANKTLPQIVSEINDLTNKISAYQQGIQAVEQQMQPFQKVRNMSWLELEARINNLNVGVFNKVGLVVSYQVLKGVLEELRG